MFFGYIVCDSVFSSELVVFLFKDGCLVVVFDLDSLSVGCFSVED